MRALIIDDEENNISNLSALLLEHCKEVNVIGTAKNTDEGIRLVQ
jgi:DNA-binding LytR/AlgR family response regulator